MNQLEDSIGMSKARLYPALDQLAAQDADIKRALDHAGYPPPRQRIGGFDTLVRVIIGQQVSVASANAIYGRLVVAAGDDISAARLAAMGDDDLRAPGLSRPKVGYIRSLAEAVLSGRLDFAALDTLPDADVITMLTSVKGLGVWSAQMYLISTLGRPDIWPVLDVGVQEGITRMLALEARPKPKELEQIGARWAPNRSAVALLAWHFLSAEPI